MNMRILTRLFLSIGTIGILQAQWIKVPASPAVNLTAPTPRLPNGKPVTVLKTEGYTFEVSVD
jgi:hypothetical protein